MGYLYTVQGYESMKYNGDLQDVSNITITAKNETEALAKAKKMITKKNYRIGEVQEVSK